MAPNAGAKAEKEQRITTIIGFALKLQKRLEVGSIDSSITTELRQHLSKSFPVPSPSLAGELDERGRSLWNISIQFRPNQTDLGDFLPQLRSFAFYLLDIAHQAMAKQGQSKTENLIRVLRVALKAGRVCIDHFQLDLCTRLFERAAAYVETQDREIGPKVKHQEEDGIVKSEILNGLVAEYYILRAALAWKSGRTDVIEYWLSKTLIHSDQVNVVDLIEKKADLLYEMGMTALKQKQYDLAVKWLQRSCDTLDVLEEESLSPDLCELRFAAMSDLIRALTGLKDPDSLTKASNLMSLLHMENTEFKLSTCLLQFNLLSAQNPVDTEQLFNVVHRIIQSVHMIDSNFETVMHQIHKLKRTNEVENRANIRSIEFACQALDDFLPRIFESGKQNWIEKIIVTRIWLVVSEQSAQQSAARLRDLFDEVLHSTGKSFSPEATHAAQSLLWKRIDTPFGAQQEAESETWCRLASHEIFQNAGDLNKSKLGRKMMLSALAKGDAAAAREAYYKMPESGKSAPVTRYIMYKIALRDGDVELASESLESVLKSSSKDATFLYACVLEAQQYGDRLQAIAALQKVLQHCDYNAPKGIYLPSLLRSTAKLILTEIDTKGIPKDVALPEVCKIFEVAMSHARSFRETDSGRLKDRYRAELKWFASYSYNLALTYLADVKPELLVRFMTVCITFVDYLRTEDSSDEPKLVQRSLICRFLAASALIVLGRSEDNIDRSLSFYLDSRRQIAAFQKSFQEALESVDVLADSRADFVMKEFELLKYDLEAVFKLKHWNDLDRVLGLCLAQQHSTRWGTIVDLIMHIHIQIVNEKLDAHYQGKVPLVMEKIINVSWKNDKPDIRKFSRWLRCLFQMTLSINPEMALKCLDNAKSMANRSLAIDPSKTYPKDELAWLATSAWNHSVDLFCAHDKEKSQVWAEKALNLAMTAGRETGLHATLQAKWLQMQASSANN